jgi:hypothetical protein
MKLIPNMLLARASTRSLADGCNGLGRPPRLSQLCLAMLAAATVATAPALTINTNNAADIATFKTGATVESFDTGLTGLSITSYVSSAVPAGNQFSSRNLADPNTPAFNSGGATFTNPASNPGTPVGVFNPDGGIAGEVVSQSNVIGPLQVGSDLSFGFGFMEVIFQNPVSKVGFAVTHGALNLILKDINNMNLAGVDSSVNGTAGNFIGIARSTADIGGVTILSTNVNDSFTLDDFTFAAGSTTPPTSSVPEDAGFLSIVSAAAFLWFGRRMLKRLDF